MCAASIQSREALRQEHAGFLPPAILRFSEHEKTGAEQGAESLRERSNLLRRDSPSQLPQPLLVALFKLVLAEPFVGSESFGQVLVYASPWT